MTARLQSGVKWTVLEVVYSKNETDTTITDKIKMDEWSFYQQQN